MLSQNGGCFNNELRRLNKIPHERFNITAELTLMLEICLSKSGAVEILTRFCGQKLG